MILRLSPWAAMMGGVPYNSPPLDCPYSQIRRQPMPKVNLTVDAWKALLTSKNASLGSGINALSLFTSRHGSGHTSARYFLREDLKFLKYQNPELKVTVSMSKDIPVSKVVLNLGMSAIKPIFDPKLTRLSADTANGEARKLILSDLHSDDVLSAITRIAK